MKRKTSEIAELCTMISFNIETLNSRANPPLQTLFIKSDVATTIFKNLLNITVFKERLNKTDIKQLR